MFIYSNIDHEKHIRNFVAEILENETPDKSVYRMLYIVCVFEYLQYITCN